MTKKVAGVTLAAVLDLATAERLRPGLPVRLGPCSCGNSFKGMSCGADCNSRSTIVRKGK